MYTAVCFDGFQSMKSEAGKLWAFPKHVLIHLSGVSPQTKGGPRSSLLGVLTCAGSRNADRVRIMVFCEAGEGERGAVPGDE